MVISLYIPSLYEKAGGKELEISAKDMQILSDWLKDPKGNIIFSGEPGRGKTHAACACLNFLKKTKGNDFDYAFCNVGELYQAWLDKFNVPENYSLFDDLKERQTLLLDDLGIKDPSPGFFEFLYSLINYRCNRFEMATIYTTNLDSKTMNEILGPRIVSRLSNAIKIKITGIDRRMNNHH